MKKCFKRFIATLVAVTALSSVAVNASAAQITLKGSDGGTLTCYSQQINGHQWSISTSYTVANSTVSCSGVGTYYTSVTKLTDTTGGGNSSGSSGTGATLYNNNGYGWKNCVSNHSATTTYGPVASWGNWTVQGNFVN